MSNHNLHNSSMHNAQINNAQTNNVQIDNAQQQANLNMTRLTLRQLFTLKSKQWLFAWFIGLLTVVATLGLLAMSGWFISAAAIAGIVLSAGAISFDFLRPAAVIRAFAMTRTAGRYGERLASHHAVLSLLTTLRVVFFDGLAKQKISFVHDVVQSADTMQRLTHDINQLDELPLRFWAVWLWSSLLQGALLAVIAWLHPQLLLACIPMVLAGIALPIGAVFWGKKLALAHTQMAEQRRRELLNPLTASTHLILWQRWQDFQQQFQQSDSAYYQLQKRQQYVGMVLNTIQQLLLAMVILLLLILGFDLVAIGAISVPFLLAYVLAIFGLYEIILPLASSYTAYGFALASQQRLNALLVSADNNIVECNLAKDIEQIDSIHVQNFSAKFPHALTGVENVNCHLQKGDVLFVTGRSGAGKSTLLHALANELQEYTGNIHINNEELHTLHINKHVGFLAQQLDIFDLTLAENLRVGDVSANDEKLWQVLEQVQLADWAREQPQQLHTPLGEYGSAISGGQARRVALARLLLKPRSLLLLDEPFAGLDEAMAKSIFNRLKTQQKTGFLIIVSHQYVPKSALTLAL